MAAAPLAFTAFAQDARPSSWGERAALTAFNTGELETLKKVYRRHPTLAARLVVDAFEQRPGQDPSRDRPRDPLHRYPRKERP